MFHGCAKAVIIAADLTTTRCYASAVYAIVFHSPHHVLHKFLPDETDHTYNLRYRRHSLSLTVKTDSNDFLNRLLFKGIN